MRIGGELSDRQVSRLMEIVVQKLRTADLPSPHLDEHEPAYTARCLQGPVRTLLSGLGIEGLVQAGEGGGRVSPVVLFGLRFYPDLAVSFHGAKTLAFEVKYLRASGRENATATALGQTYLYRQAGYRRCGAFLIDMVGRISDVEIIAAEQICRSSGIDVVVRRKSGLLLGQHPS